MWQADRRTHGLDSHRGMDIVRILQLQKSAAA